MDLIDEDAPVGNAHEFSVSDLSGAVKRVIEGAFDHVRVRGEVGRVFRARSGHLYLDLKDDRAVLASIVWKGVAARLEVQPEEGMEVIATGKITTFPGQSKYQLVIENIAPAGVGALMAMLEKRKKALAAEGLFAPERKKRLPYIPRKVGVVTSPTGAVIRDILHRLGERFPLPVDVWPVTVQGPNCAAEVAHAIRGFNAMTGDARPDVLIVARGGGSVEDLWGFNEELVVRTAAESEIPLISAVGHETDTTLIDLASDIRAPTPTAAAEIAAPVRGDLLAALAGLDERRERSVARLMEDRGRRLRDLSRALPRADELVAERRQRLDHAAERLPLALSRAADRKRVALSGVAGRLTPGVLLNRLAQRAERVDGLGRRLPGPLRAIVTDGTRRKEAAAHRLDRIGPQVIPVARDRLEKSARLLETLSYRATLARGYAVVRDTDGALVPKAEGVTSGAGLEVEFADGRVNVVASGGSAPPSKPRKAAAKKAGDQGAFDL